MDERILRNSFLGTALSKPRLTLSRLTSDCSVARKSLIKELIESGFACLALDDPKLLGALDDGLDAAQGLSGFRFPPNDSAPTIYSRATRDTFRALFTVSTCCFRAPVSYTHLTLPTIYSV